MAFGWRFVPDFCDAAVRPDQKRGAHDAKKRFAEKLLHAPCAISFDGLEFGIAQQGKIQAVLGRKFGLRFHFIAAAAQYNGGDFVELRFGVAKLGRFVDSTRSQGFRKKIEDYGFAAKARKGDVLSIGGLQPKIRSFIAHLEHFFLLLTFFFACPFARGAVMPAAASARH